MKLALPRRGTYVGRLAFDPDSGSHVDPKGRRVVTLDGGTTWRYARRGDESHNARYSKRVVEVKSTQMLHLELTAENGKAYADAFIAENQPHHNAVQPSDAHNGGVATSPDVEAATETSHTDAWKEVA